MAEFHTSSDFSTPTAQDIFYSIYQAVADASNTYVDFVQDGSTDQVYLSTGATGVPTAATDFVVGQAFFVIEPALPFPSSSVKWQLKISLQSTNPIQFELSYSGGWTAASGFGSNETTGTQVQNNTSVGAVTKLYITSATETYGSGSQYTYFRLIFREGGGNCDDALYVGGYTPFDSSTSSKPVCMLWGAPDASSGWGLSSGNKGKTPTSNAHTGTVGCFVRSVNILVDHAYGVDRSGNYIAPSCYLFDTNQNILGTFGVYTFRGIDDSVPDWSADSTSSFLVTGRFLQRYVSSGAGSSVSSVDSAHVADKANPHETGLANLHNTVKTLDADEATYTVEDGISVVVVSTSRGAVSMKLPAPSGRSGKIIIVKVNGSASISTDVAITVDGGANIDGTGTINLTDSYTAVSLFCDGTQWFVI